MMTPKTIEKYWPLSGVVVGPLQNFDNRSVLAVEADQGQFICKSTKGQFSDDEFRVRVAVLDHLERLKYANSPRLVRTKTGGSFVTEGDVRTVVLERVPGRTPEANPRNYDKLGQAVGALNSMTDYPHPAPISVDAVRPHYPGIAADLPPSLREGYLAAAGALPDIDALPRSLIHFEASLKNSIRRPDGTIVLVDWDEAGAGATVLDPGYHLISGFVSEDLVFDKASARAFYAGYLSRHRLTAGERQMLFDASLFHALRYVIYGDVEKRWRRIAWAIENRKLLMSAVPAL